MEITIGGIYEKWTVLGRSERPHHWYCKCECGATKDVYKYGLTKGVSKSCGCLKYGPKLHRQLDLTGKKVGKLTAIRPLDKRVYHQVVWLCQCDCGGTVELAAARFKANRQKSCGCMQYEWNKLPKGEASFNVLFKLYKRNARESGREFSLTREEFLDLTQKPCVYCGLKPTKAFTRTSKTMNGAFHGGGIDRVNNNLGYTIANSASCCETCNRAKRSMKIEDFLNWIKRIVSFQATTSVGFIVINQ